MKKYFNTGTIVLMFVAIVLMISMTPSCNSSESKTKFKYTIKTDGKEYKTNSYDRDVITNCISYDAYTVNCGCGGGKTVDTTRDIQTCGTYTIVEADTTSKK